MIIFHHMTGGLFYKKSIMVHKGHSLRRNMKKFLLDCFTFLLIFLSF